MSLKPYPEICLFEHHSNTFLFNKRNYKVSSSVGIPTETMHPVEYIFETDAGSNLIREEISQTYCLRTMRTVNRPLVQWATNQRIRVVGTVLFRVGMVDDRIRMVLRALSCQVVPILPDTSIVGIFIKWIFPLEDRIVLYNSASAPIIAKVIKTERRTNTKKARKQHFQHL